MAGVGGNIWTYPVSSTKVMDVWNEFMYWYVMLILFPPVTCLMEL